ncbi:MAG: HAMP domain-containing histidine kinase [Actinomycetota bacterium]|nr:HAMP domain-containing histidine kinase [Actinomycetota bacterium]
MRWRLTIFNALAIGTILVALGLVLFLLLQNALVSNLEETVRNRAFTAAEEIQTSDEEDEAIGVGEVEDLTLDGVFIIVRDRRGNILYQSVGLGNGGRAEDPVWSAALEEGVPVSGTADLSSESPDFVYAVPIESLENPARVVEVGTSFAPVTDTLLAFRSALLIGVAAAFLLSIIGAYLLARAALSPVDAIVAAARGMNDRDLSKRLPVKHEKDEIGRLATTINALIARLEAAFERREEALASQRKFVADASHELRTPLTSIRGYAKMLEGWGLSDPKTAEESVAAIKRESDRMGGLVEGLLALARGDEGPPLSPERTNLADVAEESAEAARVSAGGKVSIEVVGGSGGSGSFAAVDRGRIRQAVGVLLDNAVKYTPEGGSVEVRTFEKDGWAAVAVEDTGVGIPASQLPLVFERFHRVDEARGAGGAGLGLAIARQIAEAHGGRVEAESEPGEGSTFTLYLPKLASGETTPRPEGEGVEASEGGVRAGRG